MEAVAFGRGVKPVGFNNELKEGGEYESAYSEMQWQSPDGTKLLGILFANWYCNGMEIPVDEKEAKAYWENVLQSGDVRIYRRAAVHERLRPSAGSEGSFRSD